MTSIFKSKEEFFEFQKNGFVVIPFLNSEQANSLRSLYKKVQPISFEGFSSTIYSKDIVLKQSTSKEICEILEENVNQKFYNYRKLGASFLCKTPGENSIMPLHQDWTIVDENETYSATIWVPLQDVDERNGALMVLPGSHNLSKSLRSPSIPPLIQNVSSELEKRLEMIPLKAGEAIVFNHSLLHASLPNLTDDDRLAVTFGMVPNESQLSFYHYDNGKLKKYAVNDDFFLTYNSIGEAPENAPCISESTYKPNTLGIEDIIQFYTLRDNQKRKQMKALFADKEKQEFFEKNGFIKLQMLDKSAVDELVHFYHQQGLRDHSGYGFNMSIEDEDKEKVKAIRKKIFDVALPQVMPHFSNAKVIAGSYVVKEKNPLGVVPPHQDWTFVENENEFNSVTCWIALVPTRLENGFMGVIKGSHLFYENHRPSPSPQVPTPLMNHLFAIFPYLEMFEMQPGEALIFDHRTFHASTPNITDEPRLAIGLGFTQADATLCHYSLKQNGQKDTLLKYSIDDSFLLTYDNATISKMYDEGEEIKGFEITDEIPYNCPNESTPFLVERIKAAGNQYNQLLAEHMGKLFRGMESDKVSQSESEQSISQKPSFWKVYTPLNILREIRYRIKSN